jgi:hypothetical protein
MVQQNEALLEVPVLRLRVGQQQPPPPRLRQPTRPRLRCRRPTGRRQALPETAQYWPLPRTSGRSAPCTEVSTHAPDQGTTVSFQHLHLSCHGRAHTR